MMLLGLVLITQFGLALLIGMMYKLITVEFDYLTDLVVKACWHNLSIKDQSVTKWRRKKYV